MKKLIWIPALIIIFFVGDRLGGFVLKKLTEKSNFRYSRMYYQDADAEILLMGNSRGLMFYQPVVESLTGKSSFNFSYNGMPVQMGEALLKDYLDKYKKPELLLIDITMADRNNPALIAGMSAYAPESERLRNLIAEVNPTASGASKISHLFRYNSEIWQRAMRYLKGSDEDWMNDRRMNDFMRNNPDKEPPLDFTFAEAEDTDAEELLHHIKNMVDYAKQKGLRVELIINPYYPAYIELGKGLGSWILLAEKITGTTVHNYSSLISQAAYFSDHKHCNKNGSTQYLKVLSQRGILK